MSMEKFINLLFNPLELTCYSKDCRNTDLSEAPKKDDLFFAINPMIGRRKDTNVTYFRNFLIEIDSLPLTNQVEYVTSRMPVSSIVYSGGKSYHFIVSLETPLPNLDEYKKVAQRIHNLVPMSDPSVKNPSRFSRLPFRDRPDTGNRQELMELNDRIVTDRFLELLPKTELIVTPESTIKRSKDWLSAELNWAIIHPDAFIAERGLAGRNLYFYYLYNRLEESGADRTKIKEMVEKAYANLRDKSDFTLAEAYTAARIWS